MIQFTIHDDKGKKLRISAPHSWRELNLEQLIAIESEELNKDGLIKLFSIICGVEFTAIANSTDKALYNRIREVCSFVATPPVWEDLKCPKYLELGGKVYKTKRDVNKLMHGQIELLTELGADNNLLAAMPRAIAIIMQPQIDEGDYDGDRVDEIEQLALTSSALDAYGFALFFFRKLHPFLTIGIKSSKVFLKSSIRSATHYTDWLKVGDLTAITP